MPKFSALSSGGLVDAGNAAVAGVTTPGSNIMQRIGQSDPTTWLPAPATERLRSLRQQVADARAMVVAATERLDELRVARLGLVADLRRLKTPQWQGQPGSDRTGAMSDDSEPVQQLKAKLDPVIADMEHQAEVVARRREAWQPLRRALDHCEAYLKGVSPSAVKVASTTTVKVRKNDNLTDIIEHRRRRLRELKADARRIQSAPRPSAWAKERARQQVEDLARRGSPDCMAVIEAGEPIRFPTRSDVLAVPVIARDGTNAGLGTVTATMPDSAAMLAWLLTDQLIAALHSEIDAISDDANALTDEQRTEALAEIERDRLAVEREEIALIDAAANQGLNVTYRDDTDPRAVLAIDGPAQRP